MTTQSLEKIVVDVVAGDRHAICKFERQAFSLCVQRVSCIIVKRVNLLFRNSQAAADRSVYVLSKLATVEESYSAVDQRFQFVSDQT